jgi:hypothetical protein
MHYEIQVPVLWVHEEYGNKINMDGRRYGERNKKINA